MKKTLRNVKLQKCKNDTETSHLAIYLKSLLIESIMIVNRVKGQIKTHAINSILVGKFLLYKEAF